MRISCVCGLAVWALTLQAQKLPELIPDLMKRADVPGLSIAVIEDSKIVWVGSFGLKNAKTGDRVDAHTVFQAASLSKCVFAYAVLKLVDAGRFDLDTPLSKYLPAYVENDDRVNQITARHVLTHRTGFPNWRPNGKPLRIHFTPGERFSYSGEGFVYLQLAVEKITGKPLDAFVKESVFDPLGMTSSSYLWRDEYEATAAIGHSGNGSPNRRFKPVAGGSPFNGGGGPSAAASLLTTAEDYARFAIAVMNGTGLKDATSRAMLTPQSRVDQACSNCIGRAVGPESDSIAWGLGVGLEETAAGRRFWHWGDNGDFKAFVAGSAQTKRGVVVFTNGVNGMMIIPDIVAEAMHEKQPAFQWIRYERYDSPGMRFYRAILDQGIDPAMKQYEAGPRLEEPAVNRIGYQLLGVKKVKEAIRVFELNVVAFPKSANAWDSLAEGHMAEAIEFYRKSLELNPSNTNAAEILKKLESQ